MHPLTSILPLLILPLTLILAKAIPHPHPHPRDASTAVALLSAYTTDNCAYPPFGDYVFDFEPSGEGKCVGNGTVAKGIYVMQLTEGCVVHAYTYADCTGEHYQLNAVGCWVQFEVDNVDLGVQGVSVSCDGMAAVSSSASSSASASASATDTVSMMW